VVRLHARRSAADSGPAGRGTLEGLSEVGGVLPESVGTAQFEGLLWLGEVQGEALQQLYCCLEVMFVGLRFIMK
jgi:hypothetical protein